MDSTDPMDTTYASMSAPLPSPSSNQPSQLFMHQHHQHHQHQTSASVPRSPPRSQPLSFPKQPVQSQQQQQQHQQKHAHTSTTTTTTTITTTQPYPPNHDPYATSKEKDFCMVAEAAKRAQMAVLMRDMGDLGVASS